MTRVIQCPISLRAEHPVYIYKVLFPLISLLIFLHVSREESYSKVRRVTCLKFEANILHKLALKLLTILKDYESQLHSTELVFGYTRVRLEHI
jgi:hypothetical protein